MHCALSDLFLDLDGAANGFDDAGELGDDAVPRIGEDVTFMRCDRLFHRRTIDTERGGRGFLVTLRMTAIACHIGSEYRSEPTLHKMDILKKMAS